MPTIGDYIVVFSDEYTKITGESKYKLFQGVAVAIRPDGNLLIRAKKDFELITCLANGAWLEVSKYIAGENKDNE